MIVNRLNNTLTKRVIIPSLFRGLNRNNKILNSNSIKLNNKINYRTINDNHQHSFGLSSIHSARYFHTSIPLYTETQQPQGSAENNSSQALSLNDFIIEADIPLFNKLIHDPIPTAVLCYVPWKEECQVVKDKLIKYVKDNLGYLRLISIDVEENPEIAEAFQIVDVPVIIFGVNGTPIDKIFGTSDKAIEQRVNSILRVASSKEIGQLLKDAESFLNSNETKKAVQTYNLLITTKHLKAEVYGFAGLALVALQEKDNRLATDLVNKIKNDYPNELELGIVKKAISAVLVTSSATASDIDVATLQQKIAENPNDLQSRYDLATNYFSVGDSEKAVNEALEILKRDKTWNEEAARKLLIDIFAASGPNSKITKNGRKVTLFNLVFVIVI